MAKRKKSPILIWLEVANKSQHLIFTITAITIVSALISVAVWITSQYYQSQIDKYQNQLSSIERRLGGPDLMDLNKLIMRNGDPAPINSGYNQEGGFYATNSSFWKYKLSNPAEMILVNNGQQVPEEIKDLSDIPIYVWYGEPKYNFSDPSLDNNVVVRIDTLDKDLKIGSHPDSTVTILRNIQRIYQPTISMNWVKRSRYSIQKMQKEDHKVVESVGFDIISDDELLGRTLYFNLSVLLDHWPEADIDRQIISVQKKENIIYARALEVIKNIKINGKHYERFYVWKENLLICTKDNLYDIKIEIPSDEPLRKGQSFAQVSDWFGSFAVVDN
ncbi:hypothetical protein [Nibrella saemangeumensis]